MGRVLAGVMSLLTAGDSDRVGRLTPLCADKIDAVFEPAARRV